jgi:tetratricopeptide (TPR) repeat protein
MKRVISVIYILFLALAGYAQDENLIDSLKNQLKNYDAQKLEMHLQSSAKADTAKVKILFALSKAYWGITPSVAMNYAKQSLQLSAQIDYKKGIGNAYNSIGIIEKQNGNYLLALEYHRKSLQIDQDINDKNGIAFSLINIGNVYLFQGLHVEALRNYLAAMKISDEIKDEETTGWTFSNIGYIYDVQGAYAEALKNYKAALKIFENAHNKKYIAGISLNIAGVYVKQGNYDEAVKTNYRALKNAEEVGFKNGIANAYYTLGNINDAKGNYREALNNLQKASAIFHETEDVVDEAEMSIAIGNIYTKLKNYSKANVYLNDALILSMQMGTIEDIETSYEGLTRVDHLQGNLKQELEHYKQYIIYRDSIVNSKNTTKITQQQMQFDFDRKQVADSLMFAQEKEIGDIKLQKQKAITYGGFAGIAITIILLFFVYNNYSKQRIANKQLKDAQEQLIKSEKMAAFGVMASRLSHEIQNPLNFVNNFSELAQESATDVISSENEEDKKENADILIANLQKINEHAKRAEGIIKQLQEHSNKGTAQQFFET